jgi:hypothetical protein
MNLKEKIDFIAEKPQLLVIIGIAITVILFAVFGIYQYKKLEGQFSALKAGSETKTSSQITQSEQQVLLEKVGKLILLPKDEEPTIASVTDPAKLKDQPFFANAATGDRVIIYTNARKAILYRPSTNILVEVAPVNVGTGSGALASNSPVIATNTPPKPSGKPSSTPTPSPIPYIYIALYNGTDTSGLAKSAEKDLKTKMPNARVIVREFAVKRNYTRTQVIDISGNKPAEAVSIAKMFNGDVVNMPKGEIIPSPTPGTTGAQVIIILGTDYIPQ